MNSDQGGSPRGHEVSPVTVVPRLSDRIAEVRKSIRTAADSIRTPEPDYHVKFGRASSYDTLLASTFEEEIERAALLGLAQYHGRVLISGRGGAGKTVTLRHLTRIAVDLGWAAVLVDLKAWTGRDTQASEADARSTDTARRSRLFRRVVEQFSQPRIRLAQLDALPPTAPKLLLVDGLNEVGAELAEALLAGADRFAAEQVGASVIVADRLVRRAISVDKWALVAPMPVRSADTGADSTLLEIPFFLDAWQQAQGDSSSSRSSIIERYLSSHSGATGEDLRSLAAAAYETYRQTGSRTFDFPAFRAVAPIPAGKLVEAGVLLLQGNDASFVHHLLHDYLAARYAAEEPSRWSRDAFQVLSFRGSSFDAVSLAFEQITARKAGEGDKTSLTSRFLLAVYDWNPYAAAYCLADASPEAVAAVSKELRVVVIAMLAERIVDPVVPTRQRAFDALSLLRDSQVGADAQSPQRAREVVAAMEHVSPEFARWREIFLRPEGVVASDEDLSLLMAEDSLLGWTLANVLKRGVLSETQQAHLRVELGTNGMPTLRWRAAHVLGACPSLDNLHTLFSALSDSDGLVRYGVARSLVEMAWRDASLRTEFVEEVARRADQLLSDPSALDAMVNAFDVVDRSPEWTRFAVQVARVFYRTVDDPVLGVRWLEFAERLGGADDSSPVVRAVP